MRAIYRRGARGSTVAGGIDIGRDARYAKFSQELKMSTSKVPALRQAGGRIQSILRDEPVAAAASIVGLGAMATILGAWFFEYVLGYAPCPLCLQQRIPYYIVIPLAVIVAAGALARWPRQWLAAGLAVIALAMLVSAGLGAYHSGVEWKWWAGPASCGTLGELGSGNLLERVQSARIVRCDEAAWRFLGLSLAGWNVLISLALAGIAAIGARCAISSSAHPREGGDPGPRTKAGFPLARE
jgi:disulfide bond formation protein DsbB